MRGRRGVEEMAARGPGGRAGSAPTVVALRLVLVLVLVLLLGAALGPARATVYFREQFLDGGLARAAGR